MKSLFYFRTKDNSGRSVATLAKILAVLAICAGFYENMNVATQDWEVLGAILMNGLFVYLAIIVIFWLVFFFIALFIPRRVYTKPSRFCYWMLNLGYETLNFCARIRIFATGLEKIPTDTCFMFVSNHRSRFDNMIQSPVLNNTDLAFVSKPSNFKIPFGNRYIRRACYLKLDRTDIKQSAQTISDAINFLKNQVISIGIYPEGTRSKTGELLEFKNGCFKIALRGHCPIVVSTIVGTENIHKNFPWRRTTVQMDILDVIPYEKIKDMKTNEIGEMIYKMMDEHIKNIENNGEKV